MPHDRDDAPPAPEMPDASGGPPAASGDVPRRRFLLGATGLLGAGVAAAAGVPIVGAAVYPLDNEVTSGGGDFIPAGPPGAFGDDPVRVDLHADRRDAWNRFEDVRVGSAWVLRLEGRLVAFSTVCPHLGCAIDYDPKARRFVCPCHNSVFELDGAVVEGPSPRPMDRLDVRQEDKLVQIRYQRFKQGVKEKVPL